MQNKFILCVIVLLISFSCYAQQLPLNTCGIVHVYDASGNRIKRVYFCNNGTDPYPSMVQGQSVSYASDKSAINNQSIEFQPVEALYPNPTTGKFSITFSAALYNASVFISDANGKNMLQFKVSGYKADFNLSSVAAGVYFIKINDGVNVITKKVIKQ